MTRLYWSIDYFHAFNIIRYNQYKKMAPPIARTQANIEYMVDAKNFCLGGLFLDFSPSIFPGKRQRAISPPALRLSQLIYQCCVYGWGVLQQLQI